jgi:hypothetical protein
MPARRWLVVTQQSGGMLMSLVQNYHNLWFNSFRLENTSGHKDPVQLRLVAGQQLPAEITEACRTQSIDPFLLLTECSKDLFYKYPVGTKFLLKVKLTDKAGLGLFFYTSYKWKALEIVAP